MNGDWMSTLGKLARLTPALFLRDPLFRYAAIAAGIALMFLVAQFAQSLAGPPAAPAAPAASAGGLPAKLQSSATTPAVSGSPATPLPAQAPAIAPGRPLNGVALEPAPADSFGTLPKGANSK